MGNNLYALADELDESEELNENKMVYIERNVKAFRRYLKRVEMSDATIYSYVGSVNRYFRSYKTINKANLLKWKSHLIETYSPRTVNQRINGMNKYLSFINRKGLKLNGIRIQNKPYLENVISLKDYKYFIKKLKDDNDLQTYYIVRFLACTGARVSELVRFRAEYVHQGYMDLISKGGKIRRIYVPTRLRNEALKWLDDCGCDYGPIFTVDGKAISSGGIGYRLKNAAKRYPNIPIECVYPHSFRHMYAKAFLSKKNDLMLLADLLGHSSLETTRIYTRMTFNEQRDIVNHTVIW